MFIEKKNKGQFLRELIIQFGNKFSQYTGIRQCKVKAYMIKSGVNQILGNFEMYKKILFESNLDSYEQLRYLEENLEAIQAYKQSTKKRYVADSTSSECATTDHIFAIQVRTFYLYFLLSW